MPIQISALALEIPENRIPMREFKRTDRLNEQIRRLVAEQLEHELAEVCSGMVTFTAVELSKDLRYAKVFYSFLGSEEDKLAVEGFLQREKGHIRSRVGKGLHIRHIPEFTFAFYPSVESGMKIEKLLNEVKQKENE